jgi:hypothetical protein
MHPRFASKPALGRRLLLAGVTAGVAGIMNAPRSPAQSPASRPEFEVAAIKRNIEGGPRVFMGQKSPGTFPRRTKP